MNDSRIKEALKGLIETSKQSILRMQADIDGVPVDDMPLTLAEVEKRIRKLTAKHSVMLDDTKRQDDITETYSRLSESIDNEVNAKILLDEQLRELEATDGEIRELEALSQELENEASKSHKGADADYGVHSVTTTLALVAGNKKAKRDRKRKPATSTSTPASTLTISSTRSAAQKKRWDAAKQKAAKVTVPKLKIKPIK